MHHTHRQHCLDHRNTFEVMGETGSSVYQAGSVPQLLPITESQRPSKGHKVKFPANWTEETGTNLLACWQHLVPVFHLKGG